VSLLIYVLVYPVYVIGAKVRTAIVAGNRLFSFSEDDIDFFLPQLLTLYINMHDLAEATHPYIVYRSHVFLLLCESDKI